MSNGIIKTVRGLVRSLIMFLNRPVRGLFGDLDEWRAHWERKKKLNPPATGLTHLTGLPGWRAKEQAPKPIFVLAASWRSGSTLLQRLVMSSGQVFMWGEAYDRCDLVRRLADSTRVFNDRYPPEKQFEPPDRDPGALAREWIANLSPEPEHLARAHRTFFSELLEKPARERGFERWGYKEVRLTLEDAMYLRWLFPSARFVLLVRDPWAAYSSYRSVYTWYDRWPERPVITARQFAHHWRERAAGFVEGADELGGLLVRFEDLVAGGETLDRLEAYLELTIDRDVLGVRKSGTDRKRHQLSALDRLLVSHSVQPTAGDLGYGS